ncbi:MAG: hypothetical protein ACE5F5_08915 [Acidimicrobiia bacterium]
MVGLIVQPFATNPASAVLGEIAAVAAEQDPLSVTDTSFIYTSSRVTALAVVYRDELSGVPYDRDLLVYLLPREREVWIGNEGTEQIRTTYLEPIFFRDTHEEAYYAAGLDTADQIGQTVTSTVLIPVDVWPDNLEELDQAIRNQMASGRGLPFDVEYLDVALDIITESFVSPQLRASTLNLISRLGSLQLGEPGDGVQAFSVEYSERGVRMRLTFGIDRVGNLTSKELVAVTEDTAFGIPAGTAVSTAIYGPPTEVDTLFAP